MDPRQTPNKKETLKAAVDAMQAGRPLRAEEICRDFLDIRPGSAEHMRLLSHSLMKQNRLSEAEEQLRFALELKPLFPQLHEDLGSVLMLQGNLGKSISHFEKAIELDPAMPNAHKKLGQALAATGQGKEADEAFMEFFERDPETGEVAVGADHFHAGRYDEAIECLRGVLRKNPDNVDALCFLAIAYREKNERTEDAEALLRKATKLAPDHVSAWINLGSLLAKNNRRHDAIEAYQQATRLEPSHAGAWHMLAGACAHAALTERAIAAYEHSLKLKPDVAHAQLGYAHTLKTRGDQEGALRAYREAIRLRPRYGESYWSMANLKIFKFEDAEVDAMLEQLKRDDLTDNEIVHFHFALGKAFEDRKDYDKAWHHYDTGNQTKRESVYHDPLEYTERQASIREVFSQEFLDERSGLGDPADDLILIVGMPRSGSTLVEQILASHSQVEGTAELPVLGSMSGSLGNYRRDGKRFPHTVLDLRKRDWGSLGRRYLKEANKYRQTDRPIFTDKLPNNYAFVGMLHLILPNAKVINTFRHPLDTLLGNYKQLYGRGQAFTYDMMDLAAYYKDYYATMQHWNQVLPGKVLDLHYEDTVLDLDSQVRRILDHCGLAFEDQCLRFWETDRAVRTASSEQVRQPIYTGALGKWRRYEEHLDLWKEQLADILESLPESVKTAGA